AAGLGGGDLGQHDSGKVPAQQVEPRFCQQDAQPVAAQLLRLALVARIEIGQVAVEEMGLAHRRNLRVAAQNDLEPGCPAARATDQEYRLHDRLRSPCCQYPILDEIPI